MFIFILFIVFIFINILIFNTASIKNKFSFLSFSAGIYQVLILFYMFFIIFISLGDKVSILDYRVLQYLLIFDFIGINVYILFLYFLVLKKKYNYKFKQIIDDNIQIFLPVILMIIGIVFLSRLDIKTNESAYMYMIGRYTIALIFKISYMLSHNIIIYSKRNMD